MTGAIVVSYFPSERLLENIEKLHLQLDAIIIIDNGSNDNTKILEKASGYRNVRLIKNNFNLGIAKALNQGIKELENHIEWIFLFDQDSIVPLDYVKKMKCDYLKAEGKFGKVGQLSPVYIEENGSLLRFSKGIDASLQVVMTSLTSGSLFRVANFKITKNFDEFYFIDYVDYEYCLRLRTMGFLVVETSNLILNHQLGNSITVNVLGKNRLVTNHNSVRRYYKTRNRILTYKKYFFSFPAWVIYDFFGLLKEFASVLLFEENKIAKASKYFIGFIHGIFSLNMPKSKASK